MKLRKLLVLALVLALFVCAFAACGDGTDTETDLPGTDSETNAPVSDTEDPGKETEDPGEECTHELEVEEKLATCTDRGYKKEVCKLCGEIVSETAYPKAAHTPTAAATCTEDSKCSVCGEVLEAAKGHTFGDVVVVDATCLADGSKTQTCSICNETVVEKIPALAHDIQDVTASTAATCTTEGSKTGICVLCNQEQTIAVPAGHTFKDLGDLSALTFVNGKLQATCSGCNATVDVAGDLLLALNFDEADVPTELAKWDGFAYGLTYNPDQAGTVKYPPVTVQNADATDGHTSVLSIPHNASAAIQFGGSLLSDSDYYVISFDWRATKFEHTSNKVGGFGLADTSTLDTGVSDASYVYAFRVDRSNGELYNGASKEKFSFVAEAGRWYHIDIVVDHETGTAYTYFDGVCVATLANAKWIIAEDGTYTWRFGGIYNVFHRPEFDNFTVVAINKSESVDPDGGEEGGDPEDDGTGCDHECYLEVQLPTPEVPGFIKRTCNLCGRVVTYEIMTHICYSDTAADCVTDSRCDECGELIEAAWGHALDPNAPIIETPADPACSAPGVRAGTCIICGEPMTEDIDPAPHTFKLADLDLEDITFDEAGNIQAPCFVCGTTATVASTEKFALPFDSYAPDFTAQSGGSGSPGVSDGRLLLPTNTCVFYKFDASLLETADVYVISFDYRRDSTNTTANGKHGVIGLITVDGSNNILGGGTIPGLGGFALKIERGTFKYCNDAGTIPSTAVVATNDKNALDKITIVVDNTNGYSYIYINGAYYTKNENDKLLVSAEDCGTGNSYAWRFGGQYNLNIVPEYDNFKVAVLDAECRHLNYTPVEVDAATCIATGTANKICDKCGANFGTEDIPMKDHTPGTVIDADYADCAYKAECAICFQEMIFEKENAAHTLSGVADVTVVGDKVFGTCSYCGKTNVAGSATNTMVLNFDQAANTTTTEDSINAELAALPNAGTLGFAYGTVYNVSNQASSAVCKLDTVGDRTVLRVSPFAGSSNGNHSPIIKFSGDMLADSPYYVVSFDLYFDNANSGTTPDYKGMFGLVKLSSNTLPTGQMSMPDVGNYALVVDRNASLGILNGARTARKDVTKQTWYTVTIIVDNATGKSTIYIDGTLLGVNDNNKMLVESGENYIWLFGANYNNGQRALLDNFKVYKLGVECAHASFDTVTVNEASCVAEGTTKKVCSICGEDLGAGDPIPMKAHAPDTSTAPVQEYACAYVYACTGAADGCTETINVAKEGATHAVSAPTTFDATTVVKDGKIQAACADCGLYFDAPITEDVRVALNFDGADIATEVAALNAANTNLGLTLVNDSSYICADGVTKAIEGAAGKSPLYLGYNGEALSDATYYMISFDWRWTVKNSGGYINTFGACNSTKSGLASVGYYDRTNGKFRAEANTNTAPLYPNGDDQLTKDTWYTFNIVVDNATGNAYVFVNGTYIQTVTSDNFKIASENTYFWQFNASTATGHAPQWDNFRVEVLAKTAVTE